MIKIVPDPPGHSPKCLEDKIVQASQRLSCALNVGLQTIIFCDEPRARLITLATLQEVETARRLLQAALSDVQARH